LFPIEFWTDIHENSLLLVYAIDPMNAFETHYFFPKLFSNH
jgi:hypothetical protein